MPGGLIDLMKVLRSEFPGWSNEQFQKTIEEAVFRGLGAAILVSTNGSVPPGHEGEGVIAAQTMYSGHYSYLRLNRVDGEAPVAVRNIWTKDHSETEVRGRILDLRFASGGSPESAARLMECWVEAGMNLLDFGSGMLKSETNEKLGREPLVILVNGETSGAAEVVAAGLQDARVALVIGGTTAGKAGQLRTVRLPDGRDLSLPAGSIRFASGSTLGTGGMKPDIQVATRVAHERAWLADPYGAIASTTNSPGATNKIVGKVNVRKKLSEAELVKSRREGKPSGQEPPTGATAGDGSESDRAVLDPVLGRGLDLLKGLWLLNAKPEIATPGAAQKEKAVE